MQSKRRRPNQPICGIDATPFVHVSVVLAAMFLLGSLTLGEPHHGVGLYLPRVGHPVSMTHANREDAMIISIARDDKVFFRSDLVGPDQLAARIRESVGRGSEREVYIRADARARYSWVAEVLDNVRSAGVEKIGFLVEQRPSPKPNPQ